MAGALYTMGPASGALPSNPPTLSSLASWAASLALSRWCQGIHPATPSRWDTPHHLSLLRTGTDSGFVFLSLFMSWTFFSHVCIRNPFMRFYATSQSILKPPSQDCFFFCFLLCGPEFTSDSSVTLMVSHLAPHCNLCC